MKKKFRKVVAVISATVMVLAMGVVSLMHLIFSEGNALSELWFGNDKRT